MEVKQEILTDLVFTPDSDEDVKKEFKTEEFDASFEANGPIYSINEEPTDGNVTTDYSFVEDENELKNDSSNKAKIHKCDECGKGYTQRNYLKRHKSVHNQTPTKKMKPVSEDLTYEIPPAPGAARRSAATEAGSSNLCDCEGLARLNQTMERMEKNINANFAYFKLMLNEMRQNVNTCMSYIESTRRFDGSTAPAEIVKKLPLSFVTEIGEDDEALLIKTLSGLGGKNVGAATRRVAAQLLSNELAAEYTFRGTSTKKRFVGSQLNRIVLGAVQAMGFDTFSIEKELAEWLRQAPGRVKKATKNEH